MDIEKRMMDLADILLNMKHPMDDDTRFRLRNIGDELHAVARLYERTERVDKGGRPPGRRGGVVLAEAMEEIE